MALEHVKAGKAALSDACARPEQSPAEKIECRGASRRAPTGRAVAAGTDGARRGPDGRLGVQRAVPSDEVVGLPPFTSRAGAPLYQPWC